LTDYAQKLPEHWFRNSYRSCNHFLIVFEVCKIILIIIKVNILVLNKLVIYNYNGCYVHINMSYQL
jgi:hypothetical protein